MQNLDNSSLHYKLLITKNLVYSNKINKIEIYHYKPDEIDELMSFNIKNVDEIKEFQEKVKIIFENYKLVNINELLDLEDIDEIISQYSFTSKNKLIEDEKIQFNTIESLEELIKTLYTHLKSLKKIKLNDFNEIFNIVEELVDVRFEENNNLIKKNTQSIHKKDKRLKINLMSKKEIEIELEKQKKGIEKNKSKVSKFNSQIKIKENLISKLKFQINQIEDKESLLEIKSKQLQLKERNNSLLIPKTLLILSFGFLYYSSLNSYSKQFQKLNEKKLSFDLEKEKKQLKIKQIEFEIEEIKLSLKKINDKFNKKNIENLEKKMSIKNDDLEEITNQKDSLINNNSDLEKENNALEPLKMEIIKEEITLLIDKIELSKKTINNYINILNIKKNHNFHEGVYILK